MVWSLTTFCTSGSPGVSTVLASAAPAPPPLLPPQQNGLDVFESLSCAVMALATIAQHPCDSKSWFRAAHQPSGHFSSKHVTVLLRRLVRLEIRQHVRVSCSCRGASNAHTARVGQCQLGRLSLRFFLPRTRATGRNSLRWTLVDLLPVRPSRRRSQRSGATCVQRTLCRCALLKDPWSSEADGSALFVGTQVTWRMTAKTRRPLVAAAPAQTVRVERARIWARDAGIMSSLANAS